MPSRRQFIQQSAALATLAALGPLSSSLALAADGLLRRPIPGTDETLPVIGLGTSRTFDVNPTSEQEMADLQQVMRLFLAGGASVIDTSPSYARSEAVSGELVRRAGGGEQVFWATKISTHGRAAGLRQVEQSFRDLHTEQIDLLQVHNLQDTATHLGVLRELREEGRIRYIGITHYVDSAHDRLLEWLQREHVDFCQFNYSVGERHAEQRLLPYCRDNGIATLINRPFQRGELFDRVRGRELPTWAVEELGVSSWAQLMLKFILADPVVTCVIPATSTPRYMADNLLAGQGPMPNAPQRERIAQAFA